MLFAPLSGVRYGDFVGRCVVVTAGGTREPIDPVRVITNRSTGKMGYAVAEAARDRGAETILITAATEHSRALGALRPSKSTLLTRCRVATLASSSQR